MKLNTAQLDKVEQQLGISALPDDNPAMPELRNAFGDHTFFVDTDGLNIVENLQSSESSGVANVVKLAEWTDEQRSHLRVQEPEALALTVDVSTEEPK